MIDSQYICQWCGTEVLISIDPGAGRVQECVEDCERCCRPNILTITVEPDGKEVTIASRREND